MERERKVKEDGGIDGGWKSKHTKEGNREKRRGIRHKKGIIKQKLRENVEMEI